MSSESNGVFDLTGTKLKKKIQVLSLDSQALTAGVGGPPVLEAYLGDALRDADGQLFAVIRPRRLEALVVPCLDAALQLLNKEDDVEADGEHRP